MLYCLSAFLFCVSGFSLLKTESTKNPLVFSSLERRLVSLSILSTLFACLDVMLPFFSLIITLFSLIVPMCSMFENGDCACIFQTVFGLLSCFTDSDCFV